jgi:orotate phosphoribosyltransferase
MHHISNLLKKYEVTNADIFRTIFLTILANIIKLVFEYVIMNRNFSLNNIFTWSNFFFSWSVFTSIILLYILFIYTKKVDPTMVMVHDQKVTLYKEIEETFSLTQGFENNEKKLVYQKLKDSGILRQGHFEIRSGNHTSRFIDTSQILDNHNYNSFFVAKMVRLIQIQNISYDTIIYPKHERVYLGSKIANELKSILNIDAKNVISIDTGPNKNNPTISSQDIKKLVGKKIIYLDDILTDSIGINNLILKLKESNIDLQLFCLFIYREDKDSFSNIENKWLDQGIKIVSLLRANLEKYTFKQEDCQICKLTTAEHTNPYYERTRND